MDAESAGDDKAHLIDHAQPCLLQLVQRQQDRGSASVADADGSDQASRWAVNRLLFVCMLRVDRLAAGTTPTVRGGWRQLPDVDDELLASSPQCQVIMALSRLGPDALFGEAAEWMTRLSATSSRRWRSHPASAGNHAVPGAPGRVRQTVVEHGTIPVPLAGLGRSWRVLMRDDVAIGQQRKRWPAGRRHCRRSVRNDGGSWAGCRRSGWGFRFVHDGHAVQ